MPSLRFLPQTRPFADQAAEWFADQPEKGAGALDFSRTCVAVPTSAAGRRLRHALAQMASGRNTGVLSPLIRSPLDIIPTTGTATPLAATLAWMQVLREAPAKRFPAVLGGFSADGPPEILASRASAMRELCRVLGEGGLTPSSPEVAEACPLETERWAELAQLHGLYLDKLAAFSRVDPDMGRIAGAEEGRGDGAITRWVIAGAADLPVVVERFLSRREAAGDEVVVLVFSPGGTGGDFDAWGRPVPESWEAALSDPGENCIATAEDPDAEAAMAVALLEEWGADETTLCMADPEAAPFLTRALARRGVSAFDPRGLPLARHFLGARLLAWSQFRAERSFAALRPLLEDAGVLELLAGDAGLNPVEFLNALDQLRADHLLAGLEGAIPFFSAKHGKGQGGTTPGRLAIEAVQRMLETFDPAAKSTAAREFLDHTLARKKPPEQDVLETVSELLAEFEGLEPAAEDFPGLLREELESHLFHPHRPEHAVELNGWLEAAWRPEPRLILTGCVEGCLPGTILGHPLLPDAPRERLGLACNRTRLARDTYLLHAIQHLRGPDKLRCFLPKRAADATPLKPSRLLLRCPDEQLPARVRHVLAAAPSPKAAPPRREPFLLRIPEVPPPDSVAVTDFSVYLKCPLRYYLSRVLRMQSVSENPAEMDALAFGELLHDTLQAFGENETIRDSRAEEKIREFLRKELDRLFAARFGRALSLPLRVQRESLHARLAAFARIQAEIRGEGWKITAVEYSFKERGRPVVGGLPLRGKIDRIEHNEQTGAWRVLDYKSSHKAKSPAQTHLSTRAEPIVAEASFNDGGKTAVWLDLQLPLYRLFCPEAGGDAPPETGYFLLPAATETTGIHMLDMNPQRDEAARACAEAVAGRIARGIFWPPAKKVDYDDFETLFLNDPPDETLDPGSIRFLNP